MAGSQAAAVKTDIELGDREFRYLSELVSGLTGIVLPPQKKNLVQTRLARRLRSLGLATFGDYCELLRGTDGGDEIADMINAITTNLTRFFREDHHFEHLREEVIKPAFKARRKLRVWSAGCSTGEEPYSVAITAMQVDPQTAKSSLKILATDLDTQVLIRGRTGEYDGAGLESLPAEVTRNYFSPLPGSSGRVKVAKELREMITFNQLNLLQRWPMKGPFDAIFCRNVMIYFDRETKDKLVSRYRNMLRPNGVLYIGHSESVVEGFPGLRLMGRTIYVRES